MQPSSLSIHTCLWFDSQAEEAAQFYVSLFDDARIERVHRNRDGSALFVEFELLGQAYSALNGGPRYELSPATSLFVSCETQQEIDTLWDRLLRGGGTELKCGWVTDRFGLSWQIVPKCLGELMADSDTQRATRVMKALLQMVKLDIASLEAAHAG